MVFLHPVIELQVHFSVEGDLLRNRIDCGSWAGLGLGAFNFTQNVKGAKF